MALSAYRNAERMMAVAAPGCGVSWNLLAGIGRIESMHAYGGATDSRGTAVRPIYGPALDGTLPGNEVIVQSRTADRVTYARAMGPMQFLPGTWSRYASDGDGDGKAEVQNLFDSSLATARYLCSGGMNLRDQSHVMSAILRYNNSVGLRPQCAGLGRRIRHRRGARRPAADHRGGPRDSATAGATTHLDDYQGLGPGLPLNALGLPADDPLALMPMLARSDVASQLPGFVPGQRLGPLPGPAPGAAGCSADADRNRSRGCRRGCSRLRSRRRSARCSASGTSPRRCSPRLGHRPWRNRWCRRDMAPPPGPLAPPAPAPLGARSRPRHPPPAATGTAGSRRRDRRQVPPKHRCPALRPDRPVKDARRVGLDSTVMSSTSPDLESAVRSALTKVIDPELRRPITELGMVKNVTVEADGSVHVEVYLTTAACPKKSEISERVSQAVADVPGTGAVKVTLDVMNDEQRTELRKQLRGDSREPVIPFAQPGSLTRVYAVASGKGGVGKSSVTVNLAAAMAARGLSVGVLDADIYGHSVPRMMGTTDRPTQVESMILPPVAHDVRVISIAMFTQGNTPVVWRGPMLHRALQQFLADVYWGDLDVLLLDLPPGTGDVAISVAQLIPGAEILVVTTPQLAAAEVAERAGAIALQTRQRIVGVVENMSGLLLPDGTTMQIFGEGGGKQVAESLSRSVGADVPLLGQVPLDPALVAAGDSGVPLVLSAPDSVAGKELRSIADALSSRKRGLAGMSLGLDPAGR